MEHNTPCSDSGGDRHPHVETTGNQHVKIINSQGRWQAWGHTGMVDHRNAIIILTLAVRAKMSFNTKLVENGAQ